MIDKFVRVSSFLLLFGVHVLVSAQICHDNIAATAPDSRFSDNGDGTVSDLATGLMWKQCPEGLAGSKCENDTVVGFTWQEALQVAEAADFAGYADWRLANKNELASLVERRCVSPAINATYFPNTPLSSFWTASPYAWLGYDAWYVDFFNGSINDYVYQEDGDRYVRLVRTDSSP